MTKGHIGAEMSLAEKTVKDAGVEPAGQARPRALSLLAKLGLERWAQAAVLANQLLGR